MLNFVMAASFKDIIETNEVALNVSVWISDTVTYTSLSCEIYYDSDFVFGENLFYGFLVGDRGVNESPGLSSVLPVLGGCYIFDLLESFVFDVDIIIVCVESIPITLMFYTSWKRRFTRLLPIKPAAPVTRIVLPSRFMLYSTIKTPSFPLFRGMVRRGAEDLDPLDPPV